MRARSKICSARTIVLFLSLSLCLLGATRGQDNAPTIAPIVAIDEPTAAPVVGEEPDIPVEEIPTAPPTLTPVDETEAPALIPTNPPVVTVTNIPTSEPTEGAEPTLEPTFRRTNAPVLPPTLAPILTRAPTLVPVTVSPTAPNVTESPTGAPTSAPTNATETEPPSAAPSVSQQPTPEVLVPTVRPSKAPRTRAPTKAPTADETTGPTALPTPPEAPTSPVDRIIQNIQVVFDGATEMSPNDQIEFQNEMKDWFDSYFNGESEDDDEEEPQRRLRYRRRMQTDNELESLVRDMASTFDVTGQDVTTMPGSNIVVYTLTLFYQALAGAEQPRDYALYPFVDTTTNNELVERLSSTFPGSFANLAGPIEIPEIITAAPAAAPTSNNDKGFWTTPVIAGFASGGGVLLLVCLGWCAYLLGSRGARRAENGTYHDGRTHKTKFDDDNDDDDDDDHPHMLPTQFQMSSIGGNDDDIISTMDDPTVVNKMHSIDASAMSGGYGDQSVATVDYDYSKAYGGGGGDQSVVSSVGGTLGDATRQTAGEVLAGSAAARAALGASFDDPRGGRRVGNAMNNATRDEVMVIDAPAGKLGVVIDTPDDGAPVVHAVKETSVIAHLIQVGDKLIKVDEEDVRSMTAIKVSKLISKKSANPVRRLTIVRTFHDDQ